jgi:DNA excision repair protein ERCC-2
MNTLAVRRLAEFVYRSGDLYPPSQGRRVDAIEGIETQQKLQNSRSENDPEYAAEVSLKREISILNEPYELRGRMDGLTKSNSGEWIIEEYKSTRAERKPLDSIDYGQGLLYAGLWAAAENLQGAMELRIIYVNPDTLIEHSYEFYISAGQAIAQLMLSLCYEQRMQQDLRRQQLRQQWADSLVFPYADFRPSQRAIARRVFQAQRKNENLLLEASTGSGKTMAVLYPGLRGQKVGDKLFFLTSKSRGADALLNATKDITRANANGAEQFIAVQLTAKEKSCLVAGMPCNADLCEYAAGYYDKLPKALEQLIQQGGVNDQGHIEAVAKQHQVCPFELSLDLATWSDLIIGDYNYIFDPVVRLQRFIAQPNIHLLVDEAHQLSPRVQSMLGVEVTSLEIRAAKSCSNKSMSKSVLSLERAIKKTAKGLAQGEHEIIQTVSLDRAVTKFLENYEHPELVEDREPELEALYFACLGWARGASWFEKKRFRYLVEVKEKSIQVRQICLDAGHYADQVMSEYASTVRFSATVSPLNIYQQLHGQVIHEARFSERARTPFSSAQTHVIIIKDIPTYLQQRPQSLPKICTLLDTLTISKPGRYLLAMPSYAYLEQFRYVYQGRSSGAAQSPEFFYQERGQNAQAQQQLMDAFTAADNVVMAVVLGGGLSESVDFGEAKLSGVVIVGLGLPPPSLERNLMAEFFAAEAGAELGQTMAYNQPAMARVIQAAGRLIRSPEDRGVICLVDPRFERRELQNFFPSYWQPQSIGLNEVKNSVNSYWLHDMKARED